MCAPTFNYYWKLLHPFLLWFVPHRVTSVLGFQAFIIPYNAMRLYSTENIVRLQINNLLNPRGKANGGGSRNFMNVNAPIIIFKGAYVV